MYVDLCFNPFCWCFHSSFTSFHLIQYGQCNEVKSNQEMHWDLDHYKTEYDPDLDLTEFTYGIKVNHDAKEHVVQFRLQLPCDCLLDNCMLRSLLHSSNPTVDVDDGQFVWDFHVVTGRIYLLRLVLNGKFDDSISNEGQYALYGDEQSCAYGGNIEVPQPCKCWSDWNTYSNTCTDLTWYVYRYCNFVILQFVVKSI